MAYGEPCKNCGWQETIHNYPDEITAEEAQERNKGYKVSFNQCPGYQPRNKRNEIQQYQAEVRAAEGFCSINIRGIPSELDSLDPGIRFRLKQAVNNAANQRRKQRVRSR